MDTLYCQKCDYNLTGLPENRCPECGALFDPTKLIPGRHFGWAPISPRMVVLRLIWPPGLVFLSVILMPVMRNTDVSSIVLGGTTILLVVVFGLFNCLDLARRLSVSRVGTRDPEGRRRPDYLFVAATTCGLYFVQLSLGAGAIVGGCGVLALIM